jgi:RHS repeat-associated protein
VLDKIDYLFTGKEVDAETGWYNFGARYLNPTTGLWLSADPALNQYIPRAPLTDDDKKHNQNLPGNGGILNPINFALYHFAGNNPIFYVDPDGEAVPNPGIWKPFEDMLGAILQVGKNTVNGLNNSIVDFKKGFEAWEAKSGKYLYNSSQLRAFVAEFGKNFRLVVSDATKLSKGLLNSLYESGAKLYTMVDGELKEVNLEEIVNEVETEVKSLPPIVP